MQYWRTIVCWLFKDEIKGTQLTLKPTSYGVHNDKLNLQDLYLQ